MNTIIVEFDGTNFVPQHPVHLPVGTKATVEVFRPATSSPLQESPIPPASNAEWQELLNQIRSTPPDPPTLEEAMRQLRMRP